MYIFVWRHSKKLSSWSMFNEPRVYRENYMRAEVVVLANSKEQALDLLGQDGNWDVDELMRIEPTVVKLEHARVVTSSIEYL
ncbi:MAG TPA: hypothetical protein PLN25_06230 [Deltaproteobacteria bacterium]|nr:hypothetical protein [Deltaproteobacteria bacterium]HQB37976.1 hypothetical protein [Deltaproteobacteria bacterium]